jgi:hypothetical protein
VDTLTVQHALQQCDLDSQTADVLLQLGTTENENTVTIRTHACIAQYSNETIGWMTGSIPGRGKRFFSSPQSPEQLCSPPNLLSLGHLALHPQG